MVANLKLPTLGIPASSGAGGCQEDSLLHYIDEYNDERVRIPT
jgi:hypothetical protein